MGSAIPRGELAEIVRDARARTGVPAVVAGLLDGEEVELAAAGHVDVETPFRVASVTKWFTAALATLVLDLDEPLAGVGASARALLSHTAGLRSESSEPLPEPVRGLWSYSNSGYWAVGEACAAAAGSSFEAAVTERLLEPLGMRASGFAVPPGGAPGHVQEGETGHRVVERDAYPAWRHPSGGLWSTAGDLLRFAEHVVGGPGPLSGAQRTALRQPQAAALGATYALGCWSRELAGGRAALDHDGSVAGYQSLLLVLPDAGAALAVLTNSWRGSGLIRRVVRDLGLVPASNSLLQAEGVTPEPGRYALDRAEAVVEAQAGGFRVAEAETDPVTGRRISRAAFPLDDLGGGVYGFAGGLLMSHRVDFPRPGVARVGLVALPRAVA